MGIRASARPGLLSGKFRHGPVLVHEERWTEVDPDDQGVREVLLQFVPSHVRIVDHGDLGMYGLELRGGRLFDKRAEAAAAKAAEPKKAARAEK